MLDTSTTPRSSAATSLSKVLSAAIAKGAALKASSTADSLIKIRMSDSPARVAGLVHVRQGAHFILVSVDEQFLQQRIARILAERALQILLGGLDSRQARRHLGARRFGHRIQARLQRLQEFGALAR